MSKMHKRKAGAGIFLMVLGGWFLLIGTVFLVIGEIVTLKTGSMLEEASAVMVEAGSLSAADPSLDGKFVHAVGQAATDEILSDPDFGFSVNAMFLKRNVLYYQIVESSHKEVVGTDSDGDDITETVYEYDLRWVNHPVKSSGFYSKKYRDKNFILLQIDSLIARSHAANVGAYRLTEALREQMKERTGATIGEIDPAILAVWNDRAAREIGRKGDWVSVQEKHIHIGADPLNPQIGDVRVSFDVIGPQDVSLLARVSGDSLTYYYAKGKGRVAYLKQGRYDAASMMQDQGDEKKETSAMARLMGFAHVLFGLWLILKGMGKRPSSSRWAEVLTSGKPFWIALPLALGWTFLLCSLPWLIDTPLPAVLFLAAGLALIALPYYIRSRTN